MNSEATHLMKRDIPMDTIKKLWIAVALTASCCFICSAVLVTALLDFMSMRIATEILVVFLFFQSVVVLVGAVYGSTAQKKLLG